MNGGEGPADQSAEVEQESPRRWEAFLAACESRWMTCVLFERPSAGERQSQR